LGLIFYLHLHLHSHSCGCSLDDSIALSISQSTTSSSSLRWGRCLRCGLVVDEERVARCHPGPERHPGDRSTPAGTEAQTSSRTRCTYPIVAADAWAPGVRSVRGFPISATPTSTSSSKTATDILLARSRTLEYLFRGPASPSGRREDRARSGRHRLGWVFQYALVDQSENTACEMRSYQDWYLRYY